MSTFYGSGMSLPLGRQVGMGYPTASPASLSSRVPEFLPPASATCDNLSVMQRLDQVVMLIQDQAKETAAIKQQISILTSDVEEVKAMNQSTPTSSSSSTPKPTFKKLPTELSVRISVSYYANSIYWMLGCC